MIKFGCGVTAFLAFGIAHAADPQALSAAPPLKLAVAAGTANTYAGVGAPRDDWQVSPSVPAEQALTWPTFIREVLSANLDYAAARYDVDLSLNIQVQHPGSDRVLRWTNSIGI